MSIITLAKELHDIGRYDIVHEQFFDTLCHDSWFENTQSVITSVFSSFYSNYDDRNEEECMIFEDDVISDYFTHAWEFGRNTDTPYDDNPYVVEAANEVRSRLSFCYGVGWKLLGYTKTKKTAKQSKLIVYICTCNCGCHDRLAYSLIQLYKWFSDKVKEFTKPKEVSAA